MITHIIYTLPAYWASALVNNDFSGLSLEEVQGVMTWIECERPGQCVGCSDEVYFTQTHDAYSVLPLASECLDYTFLGGSAGMYTVWCQDISGIGTTRASTVVADNVEGAMEAGRNECCKDWGGSIDDIRVLGVAEGYVNILYWEDIEP